MTTGQRIGRELADPSVERGPGLGAPRPLPPPPEGGAPESAGEVTLFSLVQLLWRQRAVVLTTALLVTLVATGLVLTRPRTYSTTVAFAPQGESRENAISGLAAQFGLAVPLAGGTTSPQFYVELLRSRALLRAVVQTPFEVPTDSGVQRGTLVQLWRVEGDTEAQRVEDTMTRLEGSIRAAPSPSTGIVRVTVRAPQAELARQIADRLVELLNQFNLQTRRSRAAAEREFVEGRLETVRADLRTAENRLQAFLQQNRGYLSGAPALRLEEERLARDVTLQRQLFTTLAEAYEKAKIDEVRDTPVITVIEPAEAAVRPDRRGLLRTGVVALLAGLALGVLLALVRELGRVYVRQRRHVAAHAGSSVREEPA